MYHLLSILFNLSLAELFSRILVRIGSTGVAKYETTPDESLPYPAARILLYAPEPKNRYVKRSFAVSHTKDQIRDELYTIVDYGGRVLDVVVAHDIYGQIMVDLILNNRLDVDEFVERIEKSKSRPLNVLTDGEQKKKDTGVNKKRVLY